MADQAAALPSISDDPIAFLTHLASAGPSLAMLTKLFGPTAAYVQEQSDPRVAALYLAAAARHMPLAEPGIAALQPRGRLEIVEAVGTAATNCAYRSDISQSGILTALHGWMKPSPGVLTPAHVEFLQCSILAAQYRYARRAVGDEWPRPMKGSATFVELTTLRYYYQRGLLHMGCEEWQLAIRSFWTVLSVPVEEVSSISVAAWKKLTLCQCLLGRSVSIPASTSSSVSRFVTSPAESEGDDKHICVYLNLVKACTTQTDAFAALRTTYHAVFQEDGNTGMVERIAVVLLHRRVLHLAKIYSIVPVAQLSKDLKVPAEQIPTLLSQVEHLKATIEPDGMVLLERTVSMEFDHTKGLDSLMKLAEKVRVLDVKISSSTEYQQARGRRRGRARPRGVEDL